MFIFKIFEKTPKTSSFPPFSFFPSCLVSDLTLTSLGRILPQPPHSHDHRVIFERSRELQTHRQSLKAQGNTGVLGITTLNSTVNYFLFSFLKCIIAILLEGSFWGTVSLFLVKLVFTSFIDCLQGAAVSGPNFIPRDNNIGLRSDSAQSMRTAMSPEPVVLLMSPQWSLVLALKVATTPQFSLFPRRSAVTFK